MTIDDTSGRTDSTEFARAKLNLFLEVTGRRSDGYHDLATAMVEIDWRDELRFDPDGDAPSGDGAPPRFSCRTRGWSDAAPGARDRDAPDPDNLLVRALAAWHAATGQGTSTQVTLIKKIPVGAGLGGGSADAAAALRWASRRWPAPGYRDERGGPTEALVALASGLGADVPFMLQGGASWCEGTGDRMRPLPTPAGGGRWRFAVFAPPWGVNTAAAYRALDDAGLGDGANLQSSDAFLRAWASGDGEAVAASAFNRFESVLPTLSPRQPDFHAAVRRVTGRTPRLSGSGSAVWIVLPPDDGTDDGGFDTGARPDGDAARWRDALSAAGFPGVRVGCGGWTGGD